MLPDDIDLANYLADKVKLKSERPNPAEIAQYICEIRGLSGNDAEFSPDGREVVTADGTGKVRVYDLATFKGVMTLDAGEANATSAAFSPDETRIVAGYSSGTARVWDASTGLQLTPLAGNASNVETARFNADGSEVVTASDDGTIRVWHTEPRELQTTFSSAPSPSRNCQAAPPSP